ncbi:MAG TPA: TRAP transporter small permease [Hydrogenophaga sp.]|nr:TRAP transporter small permease [Hydrogenophaga sp.]
MTPSQPETPTPPHTSDTGHMTHMDDTGPLVWPAWLFLVIVAATVIEVVARYFLETPTIWANELSLFVSSIAFLCAGVYVMSRGEHLRISVLYDMAPGWLKTVFDLISLLCTWVFCVALAWFGFPTAWRSLITWERFGTAWNPPIPAVIKPLIVVVAVLLAVFALRNFLRARTATQKPGATGGTL